MTSISHWQPLHFLIGTQHEAKTFSDVTKDGALLSAFKQHAQTNFCVVWLEAFCLINVVPAWLSKVRITSLLFPSLQPWQDKNMWDIYFWLFKLHSPSPSSLSQTFSLQSTWLMSDSEFLTLHPRSSTCVYHFLLSLTLSLTLWRFCHGWVETVHVIASITVVTEQKLILQEQRRQKHFMLLPKQLGGSHTTCECG